MRHSGGGTIQGARDRHDTLQHIKEPEQHPTARVVSFVEPSLAEQIIRQATANDRSVSAEVRRVLRAAYLKEKR
jgi:hypothetical protein